MVLKVVYKSLYNWLIVFYFITFFCYKTFFSQIFVCLFDLKIGETQAGSVIYVKILFLNIRL